MSESPWRLSDRFDPAALPLADRHYNRQKIGSPQFVPPGRCLVLLAADRTAVWATSWPYAQYVQHAWPGAWICSIFRNEGPRLSSEMILHAVAHTRAWQPDAPVLGMVTFVNARKVRSANPGYCYLKAGFRKVGRTKGGLLAFQMLPAEMPAAVPVPGSQERLFDLEAS